MKKIYIFLFVWLFLFTFQAAAEDPTPPPTGSVATANSKTEVKVDARDQSFNDGSRGVFIPPLKQDGSLVVPGQAVIWQGAEKVPAYYRGQGFNYVWIEPSYLREGLTIEEMQKLSKTSSWWAAMGFGKRAIKNSELSLTRDDLSSNGGRLWILPDFPDPRIHTLKKLGEYDADGFARCSIDKLVGDGGLKLAEKGAKYIMVLATSKFLTEGDVKALGSAGVLGKLAGPAGRDEEVIAGGVVGAGIGSATAWVDRVPKIKIVAWYDITPAPKIIIPGPWPEKEPPPLPKVEAVPPPPKAEAAPPAASPAEKCEAEKKKIGWLEKELDGYRDMIREASEKLAKAEKEKIIIPPACQFSIEFGWGKWTIGADQRENLEGMARYLVQYDAAVKKLGGKFTLVGHADETVAKALNSPDKDYVNPRLGLQRSRSSKASLGPRVLWAGGTVEQVLEIAPVSAGRDTPVIVNAGKEAKNRHVYLVIVIPDIRGHSEPK